MAPTQLSRQCSDNLRFGKNLRELHHPGEILRVIAGAKLCRQLSRQRGDNRPAVFRAALTEDVRPNPVANLPAVKHQPGIHRAGDVLTRGKDQLPHIRKQGAWLCLGGRWFLWHDINLLNESWLVVGQFRGCAWRDVPAPAPGHVRPSSRSSARSPPGFQVPDAAQSSRLGTA